MSLVDDVTVESLMFYSKFVNFYQVKKTSKIFFFLQRVSVHFTLDTKTLFSRMTKFYFYFHSLVLR